MNGVNEKLLKLGILVIHRKNNNKDMIRKYRNHALQTIHTAKEETQTSMSHTTPRNRNLVVISDNGMLLKLGIIGIQRVGCDIVNGTLF